jgi:hypothetical protein
MKADAHCLFAEGYDVALTESCAEDWLMIPRRYSLNDCEGAWERDDRRRVRDYHFLTFPTWCRYGWFMGPIESVGWDIRGVPRDRPAIDDTMTFQGSCWLAHRGYFTRHIGPMDDRPETYGDFAGDQLELGLKYWLGGGAVKVNRQTWYAHLQKRSRHYASRQFTRNFKARPGIKNNYTWTTQHWLNDEEPGMLHPFAWLIEKFWPVPTWTENWQAEWQRIRDEELTHLH